MPDLRNFSVTQQGQQINVKGQLVDTPSGTVLADFGQNGINFVTWFQQLSGNEQIHFVENHGAPVMLQWLQGQWPDIPFRIR